MPEGYPGARSCCTGSSAWCPGACAKSGVIGGLRWIRTGTVASGRKTDRPAGRPHGGRAVGGLRPGFLGRGGGHERVPPPSRRLRARTWNRQLRYLARWFPHRDRGDRRTQRHFHCDRRSGCLQDIPYKMRERWSAADSRPRMASMVSEGWWRCRDLKAGENGENLRNSRQV